MLRALRPAVAGGGVGLPALHGDDAVFQLKTVAGDEPVAQLAQGEAVAHGQAGGRADEAFPAGAQAQSFDGPAGGVGAVEHPHGFAAGGGRLQHVEQGGDEGVDAAAQVLQIDQQHVKAGEHGGGGAAHLAVEAEDGDAQARVAVGREIGRASCRERV